jgi:tRNA pseudouridine55 synthase
MIVTTTGSVVDSQNAESHDAERNIFTEARNEEPRRGDDTRRGHNDPRQKQGKQPRQNNQPRRDKRDVHGWVVLDKPIGMTSTHAVAVLKRLFQAKRAGHAGTQDRSLRDGRPQALPLHGELGRGTRHRRYRGPGDPNQRPEALR